MYPRLTILLGSLFYGLSLTAQPGKTTYLDPSLHTLRMRVDGDAERMPIIQLNSGEQLEVSFDELTHEYRRYTYRIEHCDFEGKPTESLFESDYVSAAAEEGVIEDYEPSFNTTVQYTHYRFTLPNAQMRHLLSGNYRLTVRTENEDGDEVDVLQTYFGVVEKKVGIRPTCSTNTEVDWNGAHQQLSLEVDCGNLLLRDAGSEVKTLVMQNRRWDNAVINPPFTAQDGNLLKWEHCRQLIFKAGNEYRKMEMLSTRYPGMHGLSMRWFDPYYHYTLVPDTKRRNYLYDEDRDGLSLVRCEGAGNPDTEADYVVTHFTLDVLPQQGRAYYVNGRWATQGLAPGYRMKFNPENNVYELSVLMKQGYYNYLYLATDESQPDLGQTAPVEGDFYQTENEYGVLVYYCPSGGRYWQLVGCVSPIYRKQ